MISLLSELLDSSAGARLLLDTAVKSACVLLAAALLAWALGRASAAARSLIWSVAIAGVLALPLLALVLPRWSLPILPAPPRAAMVTQVGQTNRATVAGDNTAFTIKQPESSSFATTHHGVNNQSVIVPLPPAQQSALLSAPVISQSEFDWGVALLLVWLGGVLAVLVRLGVGTVGIWWLTRRAERVTDDDWVGLTRRLAHELGMQRGVELFCSEQVILPMTWGWRRAAILLPASSERWSDDCRRIVLLHELTHIKRHDCLLQTLAQVACAVYWFNPLVWLAAHRLRVERELACDDHVLAAGTKASDYAGSLVEIARTLSPARAASPVAVGMACSQLESRVRAILSPRRRSGVSRLSVTLAGGLAICLVAPLAMLHPARSAAIASTSVTQPDQVAVAPRDEQAAAPPSARKDVTASPAAQLPNQPAEQSVGQGAGQGDGQGAGQGSGQGDGAGAGTGQGVGQGRSAGELTVEQLIELKAVGVTPEYIEALRKLGYDNLTPQQLTELRAVGVSEDYIKQAREWRGGNLTVRELVELKAIGLNGDYINAMKSAGYGNLPIKQLTEMRAVGVTPEYVEAMRRLGYVNLSAAQLVSLRALGVSETFVREAQGWGFGNLSVEELTEIRAIGISSDYIRAMKALGFDNLSLQKLVELRALGVSENYIREMRALGFDNLSLEQLISMKAVGVTPDYVKKLRAAGLKNVSVNQMIEMRATGVDKILLKGNR